MSLRQIANATKISVAALEALERDDVSRLPGGIFSRAFVRSYAVQVGLDPEAMIQEFILAFPSDAVTAGHPTSGQVEDHQAVQSEQRSASTFLWLALLSVPIAGAVLYFATSGARAPRALAPAETSPPPSAPPPAAAAAERILDQKPDELVVKRVAPAAVLTVGVAASRRCWVSATADGKRQIEQLLQPGDSRVVQVRREMVLTAGDAAAIALTFNGAAARPLGRSGEVVTARFTPANFTTYLQAR